MRPADVEYLFRALKTDLTSMVNRTTSLILEGVDGEHAERLNEAHGHLMSYATKLGEVQRDWEKKAMFHRQNAGELE